MLFDLKLEIEKIVKMVQEGEESTEVEKEILRITEKHKVILKRTAVLNGLVLINDIYDGDYEMLKRDLPKYMLIKDSPYLDKHKYNDSKLSVLLKISKILDKFFSYDYTPVLKEIEARENEAELSNSQVV